jgi:hypothetical protein
MKTLNIMALVALGFAITACNPRPAEEPVEVIETEVVEGVEGVEGGAEVSLELVEEAI